MKQEIGINAILVINQHDLSDAIVDKIVTNGKFTTVTTTPPNKIISEPLALICLAESFYKPKITHFCILKKGRRVATYQSLLSGDNIIELPKIEIQDFINQIPEKFKEVVSNKFDDGYNRISPKLGVIILQALLQICTHEKETILSLIERGEGKVNLISKEREDNFAIEKDALGICLDIFGIERKKVFNRWEGDGRSNSFLNGLRSSTTFEDDVINKDLHWITGWQIKAEDIAGIVHFENSAGESLTVINANRKPLERALGVDLIYYHSRFNAFTFVQYKMMDQKNETDKINYYNPNNKTHNDELERMEFLQLQIDKEPLTSRLDDYRLGSCSIFFKLCNKISFKRNENSIAGGAYISLPHWKCLLSDMSTLGTKGGCQIGYHTLKGRYIGTRVFVELVNKGMIGTQGIASDKIALFIKDAIENGREVIYAVDERRGLAESSTRY